jgi:protease I
MEVEEELGGYRHLQGMRVAILATDGLEQTELLEPKIALEHAGAAAFVISFSEDKIKAWSDEGWGVEIPVDIPLKSAKAEDFHALLLPGGAINAEHLRMNPSAVQFVKGFMDAGKPVASICDGSWTILETGAVRGRAMTSVPSLKTDLKIAGANWVDKDVVCDGKLVTSSKPDDIPAFDREMIRLFAEERERATDIRKYY